MTDTLTHSKTDTVEGPAPVSGRTKRLILVGAVVLGVAGGAILSATSSLTPQEIQAIRAEQTVEYFQDRFAAVGTSSTRGPEYWEAVVDYYEQQWAARQK